MRNLENTSRKLKWEVKLYVLLINTYLQNDKKGLVVFHQQSKVINSLFTLLPSWGKFNIRHIFSISQGT